MNYGVSNFFSAMNYTLMYVKKISVFTIFLNWVKMSQALIGFTQRHMRAYRG